MYRFWMKRSAIKCNFRVLLCAIIGIDMEAFDLTAIKGPVSLHGSLATFLDGRGNF